MTAPEWKVCKTCREPLNTWSQGDKLVYLHRQGPNHGAYRDHAPDPVPRTEMTVTKEICDFCGVDDPPWVFFTYGAVTVDQAIIRETGEEIDDHFSPGWVMIHQRGAVESEWTNRYSEGWTACNDCAVPIERDRMSKLITLVKSKGVKRTRWDLAELYSPFFAAKVPGKFPA